jgi:hypothetical protein
VKRTVVFCWLSLGVAAPIAAHAGEPQQTYRTASWYAEHPAILDQITRLCRNDPGRAVHNPDCANASQAEVLVALKDSQNSGDLTPPSNPRYWKIHPGELAQQLWSCDHVSEAAKAALYCAAAYAAAGRK